MKKYIKSSIKELKDTNEKINNSLLEDAKDFFDSIYNASNSETPEKISKDVEYLMPFAQEFEEKNHLSKPDKRKTVFRALVIELILTLCFGSIGIPSIFRKEKKYGFIIMFINAVSIFLLFRFQFWLLMVLSGFLYFFEVSLSVSRIILFLRGNNYFKKFKSDFEYEDNFSFTEL
jgi:hypothetical protein